MRGENFLKRKLFSPHPSFKEFKTKGYIYFLHSALFRPCHPERAILLRVERGARHEVSGSRIKFCYLLVDPVLRTPLRGSTSLRSAQDDTRSLFERTMCAKTSLQESFLRSFFSKKRPKFLTQTNSQKSLFCQNRKNKVTVF